MIFQSNLGQSPNDLSPYDLPGQMIFQSYWSQSKQFPSPNDPSPVDPSLNDRGPWVSTDLEHPDHKSTGGRNDLPARVLGHPAEHWREVARETKPGAGKFFLYDFVSVAIFPDSRYCESSNIPSLVVASPYLQPVHSLNHLLPGRFLDRSRVESPHLQQAGLQMIFVVCLFCYLLHPYFQKAWLEISFASCYLH